MPALEPPRIYPSFRYRDPSRMVDWLTEVIGFELRVKYGEGNDIHHAELSFGSSMIMVGNARDDDYGALVGSPGEPGGKSLYVAVENADRLYARIKAAGGEILQELHDKDYGSRDFTCRDPEGNVWSFGTYWPKATNRA